VFVSGREHARLFVLYGAPHGAYHIGTAQYHIFIAGTVNITKCTLFWQFSFGAILFNFGASFLV
jgi:hypothetical protein